MGRSSRSRWRRPGLVPALDIVKSGNCMLYIAYPAGHNCIDDPALYYAESEDG
ncbi:MAG: hypothetical protein R3E12_18970 [Candidatus Eisenbacteria bacterium]